MTGADSQPWWSLDVIGTRVLLTTAFQQHHDGRLLSYVAVSDDLPVRCRIETDEGEVRDVAEVVFAAFPPACSEMYVGENWSSLRCERAPGHDVGGFHCDRYGRTW